MPSIKTTVYDRFRGADFSTDPSLVDPSRSPLCTNLVADEGGMPEKRCGWRVLHRFTEPAAPGNDPPAPVNGLHRGVFNGAGQLLVHAGTRLYRYDESTDTALELLSGLADHKSRSAFLAGRLWILTGGEFLSYDGTTARRVTESDCTVPTVLITCAPSGGGQAYEPVNMATPWRIEQFQADGAACDFTLSAPPDPATLPRAWVYSTDDAEWQEQAYGTDFTLSGQTITFAAAPPAPAAGSADMVKIQYSRTVPGYADRLNGCTLPALFGLNGGNRLCLSGNPALPHYDFTCALDDPTYWPDTLYATVGSARTAIRGYLRSGSSLAIVKEDDGQEPTVYLRSAALDGAGEIRFTLEPALAGSGAVAPGSFATLLDDPLFLSATGVRGLSVPDRAGSRVTQNRSYFVDPLLRREPDLPQAEGAVWNGLYLLAFPNGHCYVLDGRQPKTYRSAALGDYVYECWYWENVPARCFLREPEGERLYFGTAAGELCRFASDDATVNRFADDGAPIRAVWATRYDDDGTPGRLKTLLKNGCCVTLKPFTRSGGAVAFRSDRSGGLEQPAARGTVDIFSFADVDFERFTFCSDDSPREIFFRKKVKNYKRLQILVRNDELHEGFGVYQITKNFVVGNYAKR